MSCPSNNRQPIKKEADRNTLPTKRERGGAIGESSIQRSQPSDCATERTVDPEADADA